jgi:hypothetical protein
MMGTVWFVLGVLACPLGMAAMGGVAWLLGKRGSRRTSTIASAPDGRQRQTPVAQGELQH